MNDRNAIIITISREQIGENGYRHWLRNFLTAMNDEGMCYYLRQGTSPKDPDKISYVYLCIGNRIRFRAYFGGLESGEVSLTKSDGKVHKMQSKCWVVIGGPIKEAPYTIEQKGFRGFRYTEKLF